MITTTYDFPYDPYRLVHFFSHNGRRLFFLDSSLVSAPNGRYSFMGWDPFLLVEGSSVEAFEDFKRTFRGYTHTEFLELTPFSAGAVGYLSYDLGMKLLGLTSCKPDSQQRSLFHFGFYDVVLTIDHFEKKLHITSSGLPEMGRARQNRAQKRLCEIDGSLQAWLSKPPVDPVLSIESANTSLQPQAECTKEEYVSAVVRALDHIRQGNIYEINLSHALELARPAIDPLDVYRRLRSLSSSHFSAYYDAGSHQILSSSPERFLSLRNGMAQIRPMKGTRPRGKRPQDDERLRRELNDSPKEIAELLMVTDLERNDLGRVCEFGSVKVTQMRTIEEYQTVFQATSTVEGRLRHDCDSFDLIEACFPGGSVTGCPKMSAMRIIDELEKSRRGIYTGALGYLDFSGNLDFNIVIRTLLVDPQQVSFRVGGGIVADSDPAMEYDETRIKARALIQCLQ